MIKSLPLKDKKVLVPRGESEAKSFSHLLKGMEGFQSKSLLLLFVRLKSISGFNDCLNDIDTYDWIIFTSNVTVETFFSLIRVEELDTFPKIAVIGKKTAEILERTGING